MSKKEFSKFFIATLKRTAQNVAPLVRKKQVINARIELMKEELSNIQMQIDSFQGPIKEITGGYTTEDLVVKETVDTGKKDAKGNAIKTTSYKLLYPETVIPPVVSNEVSEGVSNITNEEIKENTENKEEHATESEVKSDMSSKFSSFE